MKQTPTKIQDLSTFANALHLHPTVEAVVEYNVTKLRDSGKQIATIKAVHTGVNASKAQPDDASGLEAVVCLAHLARVMLTNSLWVDVGLVNGAMGTIQAICYQTGGPPALPIAVMVRFDKYSGPTLHDGTVPITPIRRTCTDTHFHCRYVCEIGKNRNVTDIYVTVVMLKANILTLLVYYFFGVLYQVLILIASFLIAASADYC